MSSVCRGGGHQLAGVHADQWAPTGGQRLGESCTPRFSGVPGLGGGWWSGDTVTLPSRWEGRGVAAQGGRGAGDRDRAGLEAEEVAAGVGGRAAQGLNAGPRAKPLSEKEQGGKGPSSPFHPSLAEATFPGLGVGQGGAPTAARGRSRGSCSDRGAPASMPHASESASVSPARSVQPVSPQPVSVSLLTEARTPGLGHCSPAWPPWPSLLLHGKPGGPCLRGSGLWPQRQL